MLIYMELPYKHRTTIRLGKTTSHDSRTAKSQAMPHHQLRRQVR